jgi:hypothetical protein
LRLASRNRWIGRAKGSGSQRAGRPLVSTYRLAALLALFSLVLPACSDNEDRRGQRSPTAFAVLTDGRLVKATASRVVGRVRLARTRLKPETRRLLAVTPDRRLVGVLLRSERSARTEVALVTARGLRIHARVRLRMDRGAQAVALVAPTPHRLVVLGDRRTGPRTRLPTGWVIDATSGEVLTKWTFPESASWRAPVIDAAVSPDGRRLYLSYHGGVDVISWVDGRRLCRGRPRDRDVCISDMHGEVAATPSGVVGTGADDQTILEARNDGRLFRRWPTRLDGNHLMRLGYDPDDGEVFALGSCLYSGGVARVDLARGLRWQLGASRGGQPSLCGERIAARGGFAALSRGPEFEGPVRSRLTLLDTRDGSVRGRIPLSAPAADVVLVP